MYLFGFNEINTEMYHSRYNDNNLIIISCNKF